MHLVSVIMGVHRPDRQLLREAVRSIQDQTYSQWELIICDDGSEEGTWKHLNEMAHMDQRIRVIRHKKNRGLAAALNSCLKIARGEYIARQDDDDVSLPHRLGTQLKYLQDHPECACVGSAVQLFDGTKTWAVKRFPPEPQSRDFLFALPFVHGSLMFSAQALREVGGYRCGWLTSRTEDYELMMRLHAKGYRSSNVTEPLYRYREDTRVLGKRKYRYRIQEVLVRAKGFYRLDLYPLGLLYVVKPLAVGLVPAGILQKLKIGYYRLH